MASQKWAFKNAFLPKYAKGRLPLKVMRKIRAVSKIHRIYNISIIFFVFKKKIFKFCVVLSFLGFQVVLVVKNPPTNAGDIRDTDLLPRWWRSPRGRQGNPLQYACQENTMKRGPWWATVHKASKSRKWLKGLSRHTLSSLNDRIKDTSL